MDKDKIIDILEQEREKSDDILEEHNAIIEFKRLEEKYGIIKGFIYRREKDKLSLIFRGGINITYKSRSRTLERSRNWRFTICY